MTRPRATPEARTQPWREFLANRAAVTITAVVGSLAIVLVVVSLRRPELQTFAPSSTEPDPAGSRLVGPMTFTVDARDPQRLRFFSFSLGGLVADPGPLDWDLAFRRSQVIVNGGDGFAGLAGIIALGEVSFDSVTALPAEGYAVTESLRGDSITAVLEDWYVYSFVTHLLSPRQGVYGFQTADGRYGKLRFLSYYCPGAQPGCVTFEYVYQGGVGRQLLPTE
jgi:hypothetical protein